MKFKVGEKVKVLDGEHKGVVVKIQQNLIVILNEFGFEESYSPKELIPDIELLIDEFPSVSMIDEVNSQSIAPKIKEKNEVKEIDLHFGNLVDYPSRYEGFEILTIQLSKVREEIELAKTEKRKKIILIHGHGSGKLKEEILKLLHTYRNIDVYDASFRKFNGGATVVEFR